MRTGVRVPKLDPRPGRSAALTAAFGTELTAGELHGLKDGRGDSPPLRLSWLRRALEKRLPASLVWSRCRGEGLGLPYERNPESARQSWHTVSARGPR